MYLAVGSGTFYDVGRSYRWLGYDGPKHTSLLHNASNHTISAHARLPQFMNAKYDAFLMLRKQGYDSVQFPHTREHNMWKFEIVDIRPLDDVKQRSGASLTIDFDRLTDDENPVCLVRLEGSETQIQTP